MRARLPIRKISVNFYLLRQARNKMGLVPVELVARFHGQTWWLAMGFSVDPQQWDDKAQRLSRRGGEASKLNGLLADMEKRVRQAFERLLDDDPYKHRTAAELEAAVFPEAQPTAPAAPKPEALTFPQILEQWKSEQVTTSMGSLRRFDQVVGKLEKWRPGLTVGQLTESLLKEYLRLLVEQEIADTTIGKHVQFLREARKVAGLREVKWLSYSPRNAPRVDLHREEVLALVRVELRDPKLQQERDCWLLQMLIGRRIGDMEKLNPNQLESLRLEDGRQILCIRHLQQKTMSELLVPLPPLALQLGEKWGWQFPPISVRARNELIKLVAFHAGLTRSFNARKISGRQVQDNWRPVHEVISSHTARHTCASLMLEYGPPGEGKTLAKAMLGHADEDVTDIYAKEKMRRLAPLVLETWKKILGS